MRAGSRAADSCGDDGGGGPGWKAGGGVLGDWWRLGLGGRRRQRGMGGKRRLGAGMGREREKQNSDFFFNFVTNVKSQNALL